MKKEEYYDMAKSKEEAIRRRTINIAAQARHRRQEHRKIIRNSILKELLSDIDSELNVDVLDLFRLVCVFANIPEENWEAVQKYYEGLLAMADQEGANHMRDRVKEKRVLDLLLLLRNINRVA